MRQTIVHLHIRLLIRGASFISDETPKFLLNVSLTKKLETDDDHKDDAGDDCREKL